MLRFIIYRDKKLDGGCCVFNLNTAISKKSLLLELGDTKVYAYIGCTVGQPSTEMIELNLHSFGFTGNFKIKKRINEDNEVLLYSSEELRKSNSKHLSVGWKKAVILIDNVDPLSQLSIDLYNG